MSELDKVYEMMKEILQLQREVYSILKNMNNRTKQNSDLEFDSSECFGKRRFRDKGFIVLN